MNTATEILGLIKFLPHEYVDDFLHGKLYMNPVRYFVEQELNSARRDEREGHEFWINGGILSVKIGVDFTPIPGIIGPIGMRYERSLDANVFCMYAGRENTGGTLVDPRNMEFGDTFAILRDANEFLRRVNNAAMPAGQALSTDLVTYVDKSIYNGPMGIFRKSSDFSYQSEFRIAMIPGHGKPFVLDVGDLSDLVITGPLAEINDRLRYCPSGQLPT